MGNTTSTPQHNLMYNSLSPSPDKIITLVTLNVKHNYPDLDYDFIYDIAHYVITSKKQLGSHRGYYAYYHEKCIAETIKLCKLRNNMRFLVHMILFKIRLKYVIIKFRERYYRPPNETNLDDKGGVGYQKALKNAESSFIKNPKQDQPAMMEQ